LPGVTSMWRTPENYVKKPLGLDYLGFVDG